MCVLMPSGIPGVKPAPVKKVSMTELLEPRTTGVGWKPQHHLMSVQQKKRQEQRGHPGLESHAITAYSDVHFDQSECEDQVDEDPMPWADTNYQDVTTTTSPKIISANRGLSLNFGLDRQSAVSSNQTSSGSEGKFTFRNLNLPCVFIHNISFPCMDLGFFCKSSSFMEVK